jgi:membrane-associated HD superfamily phosphohydrolase
MDKLGFYAFDVVVLLYLVTCFLVYRYSGWYWGHDFFSLTSFLTVAASCWILWAALYGNIIHGDPATRHDEKVMLITVAVLLYASVVIFNIYKTGYLVGSFGSVIQASVYVPLALYGHKVVIVCICMLPYFAYLRGGNGCVRIETETVYRTRNY